METTTKPITEQTDDELRAIILAGESASRELSARVRLAGAPPVSVPPVDWNARAVVDGSKIVPGATEPDRTIEPSGMQKSYVVLSDDERAKGFVRPVRRTYVHTKCGTSTTMGQRIAETYAREPKFYGATFCCACAAHLPVGPDGEFVWHGTEEKVGT
jgi:hypothetical protein